MNIPTMESYEDMAIDAVVSTINKAQEKLGIRKNLFQFANSRKGLSTNQILSLGGLKPPLAISSEKFIKDAIEKTWRLRDTFEFHIDYLGGSQDEVSQYYYFEAIFSQPTCSYPIPQTSCSVFFRVEDKHINPIEYKGVPEMVFRIEGHHADHDVRYVRLIPEWILEVLMMKMRFFKYLEDCKRF